MMMTENRVKKKIMNGQVVSFVSLESTHPGTAEVLALAGADMICIDNEHGCFSSEQIVNTTRAITALGKAAILRTTCCDSKVISHYMDCGLTGIFATMIKDAEAARAVIDGVKFAPIGKRSVCFNSRAAQFGLHGMSAQGYMNFCNDNTLIMVNIECQSAVEDLAEIVKLDQIDIILTGVWDLASSYGYCGCPEDSEVQKINTDTRQMIAGSTGISCADISAPEEIPEVIKKGFKVINLGSDYNFISNYVKACQQKIDAYNMTELLQHKYPYWTLNP